MAVADTTADPTDDSASETPDPTLETEIDYHADNTAPLRTSQWRESIVANYALYGIDVEFVADEALSQR